MVFSRHSITNEEKIDSTIEQILQKFQDIFDVANVEDKSKELLAVESLTIESDAFMIIRLCEDMLTMTRGLKEVWCLGTMRVEEGDVSETIDVAKVHEKFNQLIDTINQKDIEV